jgi:hypothetical protein
VLKIAGVPPPRPPAPQCRALEQRQRLLEKSTRRGRPQRKRHDAFEVHSRHLHDRAREIDRGLRRLHAVAAHAGIAFDEKAHVDTVADGRFGEALRDDLVVEHDGEPPQALGQRHQPVGLGAADDVEREQDVVGDAGVGEDFDLAQLLAGDPGRARLHLQLPERGNLVRLDVRSIGDAVLGQMRLHAADVVLHDRQIDGDGGCVEVGDRGHCGRFHVWRSFGSAWRTITAIGLAAVVT